MNTLNRINESVLEACIRTDKRIGFEITVHQDDTTCMYGETVYNILIEGEVNDGFFDIERALEYLDTLDCN